MSTPNPLYQLTQLGQSVWLDYISRDLITSGELTRLMRDDCVTGLTSNPTIFAKALAQGNAYDDELQRLVENGVTDPDELFLALSITDIQNAADTIRPVFDATNHADGFVSLEVPPSVAHDTDVTIRMARTLWERVNRPNLMVKIPATAAGIPAIEQCIADGININVTLIFSLDAHDRVIDAYLSGLEKRQKKGSSLDVHSVASFFVSRVDTAVDKILEQKRASELLGTAAIANAVLAYELFEKRFASERFSALKTAGAHVQRPLWASTSAKNPAYRDVVYAEALIGPDTVDTMPPATIEAFRDHGIADHATVRDDYATAHRTFDQLAAIGVDMAQITQDILDAGVALFADSYREAVATVAKKATT